MKAYHQAVNDLTERLWDTNSDQDSFGRILGASRDKYRDLGRDKHGREVTDAAMEVVNHRQDTLKTQQHEDVVS